MINVVIPLSTYYGNCEWSITGYEYEKLIWSDENVPKPTLEELTTKYEELVAAQPLKELREERNRRLAEVDWVVIRAFSMNTPVTDDWKTYMQALRDLPSTTEDPVNPVWPTPPQ